MKCEWAVSQDLEKRSLSKAARICREGWKHPLINGYGEFQFTAPCIPEKVAHIPFAK